MGSNCEPDETVNHLWDTDSYKEMESKLHCLRSLVCDLLKTNQELRDALLDARSDVQPRKNRAVTEHYQGEPG
jgi:hypothetical protein